MKNYGKNTYKTLQIRLSDQEYKEALAFFKRFKKTRRETLLVMLNYLDDYKIIRDNQFWFSSKTYAHSNNQKYIGADKKGGCEVCGRTQNVIGHHHDGYEGENAYKVHFICLKCHGRIHSDLYEGLNFKECKTKLLKYYKCEHSKYRQAMDDERIYERICDDCGGNIIVNRLVKNTDNSGCQLVATMTTEAPDNDLVFN